MARTDTVDQGAGDLVITGGMAGHLKLTAHVFGNDDEQRTKNVAIPMDNIGAARIIVPPLLGGQVSAEVDYVQNS